MDDLRIRDFGSHGILIEFAERPSEESLSRCRGLRKIIESQWFVELGELTSAYCSILLEFRTTEVRDEARNKALPEILRQATPLPATTARLHEIPVIYDGPDLSKLAERNGLSVAELIELHAAPEYSVYQIGFSPGFPYLGPLNPRLHAPRMDTPRLKVPAGSVGIGGEHTGIYGIPTPGGWWLIGRTEVEMFSLERAKGSGRGDAFLLAQGDRVKFIPVKP